MGGPWIVVSVAMGGTRHVVRGGSLLQRDLRLFVYYIWGCVRAKPITHNESERRVGQDHEASDGPPVRFSVFSSTLHLSVRSWGGTISPCASVGPQFEAMVGRRSLRDLGPPYSSAPSFCCRNCLRASSPCRSFSSISLTMTFVPSEWRFSFTRFCDAAGTISLMTTSSNSTTPSVR